MKNDCTTNSHYLTYTFLFRKVGRMYFLNLGEKGVINLIFSEPWTIGYASKLVFFFISEAVTGVVGRADVGSCLFFISALSAYIKSCEAAKLPTHRLWGTNWSWLLCSLVFCLASMLTKELGITVLGVCAVYDIVAVSNFTFQDLATSAKKVRFIMIVMSVFVT